MASIMTNAAALTALQSLNATQKSLDTTQSRISTGYRVSQASDNAAYWSIATTMRSDNQAMSTVSDSLGLGASKVDTAYTGMNSAITTINSIQQKLTASYGQTDAAKEKTQVEIAALQAQLKGYADSATFSGTNMLSVSTASGTAADVKVVSAFNRTSAGAVSISTIDVKVESIKLYDSGAAPTAKGILDTARLGTTGAATTTAQAPTLGGAIVAGDTYSVASLAIFSGTTAASDAQISQMMTVVDAALKDMTTAATKLGAAKSSIDLQKTFTQSLMDSIDRGVGQLVDADMNKESTRLQALQVQQQLGVQALSIANGSSQSILSLFRG
ncbi:flagellin [Mesorhizobium sp. M00.F.Ca.ET.151.01.1.1]|uniref:flagellin N-terminal helical domain-containing protein n=1 Tax=unclassified Mesorhizobium TaxID=325217 RepID=UPI001093AAF9|nr:MULTISPECIES: flagellin [unclassified Mesorhizobium]TGU96797.1 flagellin [Mesorhizobium sp. M00.F.Ca.ET.151.01.1.1]TGV57918.1 flagellin [bacterium M00.F.Ca.ET.141.01.1.1]TGQ82327.1 flagellin [Mesorhizobium sp. M8A.F.Ca.ET.207.01.1.1]TGS44979.1 flagellin [Mesorhizobium sp. M8A.F.Ca.ET.182.01.1.1]TGS80678.1 flagellin [Mesorhizobium sp. M8A.F.Ca.ET.181.01.1.1]